MIGGMSTGDMPYGSRRKISTERAKALREDPDGLIER